MKELFRCMKIFIEGTPILTDKRSGVGQYTKRLVEAMASAAPENNYTVFGFNFFTKRGAPPTTIEHPRVGYRFVRWLPGRGYNLLFKKGLKLPIDALLRAKPDIVLYPNFVHWPLWGRRAKSVIVLHDIGSFLEHGQFADVKNRRFLQKQVPYSINHAAHIIAVSEFTKQEIVRHYHVDSRRISVVTPALDHSDYYPRPVEQIKAVHKKYELPARYILFVSTLEPRKNVAGLLDAFAALPAELQQQYPLIFIGGKGWADEAIQERFARYASLPIRRLGYVPDEDMAAVYSGASLFAFPTFYEGFGMTPLEAMACGVPVVTSNVSSVPEVVGDAAQLVDPHDTPAITAAMQKVLSDPGLAADMRKRGLAQAQKFTWEKSARRALKVFEKLVETDH
jgi:glycosyltransferase involved in cell wall biosynthesis